MRPERRLTAEPSRRLARRELRPGTSQKHVDFAWAQELTFAGERELAWVLRWALARVLQVRPVVAPGQAAKGEHVPLDEKRGIVDFERYLAWRERERGARPSRFPHGVRVMLH